MFKFTRNEIRDLLISFFVISLAFSIVYCRRDFSIITLILPITMIGVGLGFIFHEIGHKIASMHYGYWAEYKLWGPGLILALVGSLFGFVLALPGAVYTYGNYVSKKENGVISVAGPIVNIILSAIFILLASLVYINFDGSFLYQILFLTCTMGFYVNAYLAVFNLIPIGNLDGSKVIRWNPIVWIILFAISGVITYLSMTMGPETIIKILLGI